METLHYDTYCSLHLVVCNIFGYSLLKHCIKMKHILIAKPMHVHSNFCIEVILAYLCVMFSGINCNKKQIPKY